MYMLGLDLLRLCMLVWLLPYLDADGAMVIPPCSPPTPPSCALCSRQDIHRCAPCVQAHLICAYFSSFPILAYSPYAYSNFRFERLSLLWCVLRFSVKDQHEILAPRRLKLTYPRRLRRRLQCTFIDEVNRLMRCAT